MAEGALASYSANQLMKYIDLEKGFQEFDDIITNYDTRGSKGFDDRSAGRGIDKDGYISLGVMPEPLIPQLGYIERNLIVPNNNDNVIRPSTQLRHIQTTQREVPIEVPKVPLDTSWTKNIKLDYSFTKNIKPVKFDTDFYNNLTFDSSLIKKIKLENSKFKPRTNRLQQQALKDLNTSFNPDVEIGLNDFIDIPEISKLPIFILIVGISAGYYYYKKNK